MTESVLAFLGARHPERAAPAFVALIDGFLLHRVARPDQVQQDAEALFEAMLALFIACVMDAGEFEKWRERSASDSPRGPQPGISAGGRAAGEDLGRPMPGSGDHARQA